MKFTFLLTLIFVCFILKAQDIVVSGFVEDIGSNEKLPGATIYDTENKRGVITNNYGFYSISLPRGRCKIEISYIGCITYSQIIELNCDTIINFSLVQSVEIGDVNIIGDKISLSERNSTSSIHTLDLKEIAKLPVTFSEPDLLKNLQHLPGVQGGNEGTGGLNVRGGSADQNLILLDDAPVYNVNHLFGFFSVFNTDAIKSASIIKGGFPARYGGRLSSVIDIQMYEGNMKKTKGAISCGLISSKFKIEGPIQKNKSSYMLSARRTYFDLLMKPFISGTQEDNEKLTSGYFFYDLNAKTNFRINDKNHLYISFYSGKDKAYMTEEVNELRQTHERVIGTYFDLSWKNLTSTVRYNHVISNKMFWKSAFIYSHYNFTTLNKNEESYSRRETGTMIEKMVSSYGSDSGIENFTLKSDLDVYLIEKHSIKTGILATRHVFTPELSTKKNINNEENQIINRGEAGKIYAEEFAIYLEDDWDINPKLKVNIGARLPMFFVNGKSYIAIEPRLSLKYQVTEHYAIKAAYSQMNQYMHLASNSSVGLPTDLWVASTKRLKPGHSEQLSIANEIDFGLFNLSVEAFYKKMKNLIEFNEGAQVRRINESWEENMATGKGQAYGLEFMLNKSLGKSNGRIAYTLMKSERKFDDLNYGNTFPFKYDRRHSIVVLLTHNFNENFNIGASWVFNTGNVISFPELKYKSIDGETLLYYEGRNAFRLPAFHHLDLNVNLSKQKKRGIRTWTFSIYNLYNRQNPFFIWLHNKPQKSEVKQFSLFPIIPSFSYSFKFG